jgi:hypothetical protein
MGFPSPAFLETLADRAEHVACFVQQDLHGDRLAKAHEKFWRFHSYQGGDPAITIDWRQSARTDKLYVREREVSETPLIAFWVSPALWADERFLEILFAFAYLCLDHGAQISWLGQTMRPFQGRARYRTFVNFLSSLSESALPPVLAVPKKTNLVFCMSFGNSSEESWRKIIPAYQAQEATGVLVDSRKFSENAAIIARLAQNCGWPFVPLNENKAPHEDLMLLFEALVSLG